MLTSSPFYNSFVQLPPAHTPTHISLNSKFYPFFKGCIGAVDGSHIPAFVAEEDARYRNRKGFISQNVFAACTFSAEFAYILSGWEGSAADGQVFDNARRTDFLVPQGFFYLADAGFPLCDSLMVPYRCKRYHLREWGIASLRCVLLPMNSLLLRVDNLPFLYNNTGRPRDYEELFNLRHSQLRNVIERLFGIFKKRFKLAVSAPEYSIHTQARLVPAAAALHNFIRMHSHFTDDMEVPDTLPDSVLETDAAYSRLPTQDQSAAISNEEKKRASAHRDRIAKAMWTEYRRELRRRGLLVRA